MALGETFFVYGLDKPSATVYILDMELLPTPTTTKEEVVFTSTEQEVRDFAAQFPTPNVLHALALCEAGTLRWAQVAEIFRSSLAQGLEAVR
jgi:hypothetical protein